MSLARSMRAIGSGAEPVPPADQPLNLGDLEALALKGNPTLAQAAAAIAAKS